LPRLFQNLRHTSTRVAQARSDPVNGDMDSPLGTVRGCGIRGLAYPSDQLNL